MSRGVRRWVHSGGCAEFQSENKDKIGENIWKNNKIKKDDQIYHNPIYKWVKCEEFSKGNLPHTHFPPNQHLPVNISGNETVIELWLPKHRRSSYWP